MTLSEIHECKVTICQMSFKGIADVWNALTELENYKMYSND